MLGYSIHGILKVNRDTATLTNAAETVVSCTRPNGTSNFNIYQNANLLADNPGIGKHYMAGLASFALASTWAVANIFIRKVEKQLVDGTWDVVFEDAVGVEGNDTTFVPFLTEDLPIEGEEKFRYTFYNNTGGDVAGSLLGRYLLGMGTDAKEATGI